MYLFGAADRFNTEIVPGVSSFAACAAVSGFPLTARRDVLTVLPGPLPDQNLPTTSRAQTPLLFKVGRHLGRLKTALAAHDLLDKAMYRTGKFTDQVVKPLADVTADKAPYFSMILVHKRGTPMTATKIFVLNKAEWLLLRNCPALLSEQAGPLVFG